eukprot:m.436746 g.436746  ORF g.436746 m.436746 type:complete len:100 (+) comp56777_c0_seq2:102-401(+)
MVLIIGITGGPSSGKTEVAATVTDSLAHKGHGGQICTILQEYFYRDLTDAQKADPSSVNFDHPCLLHLLSSLLSFTMLPCLSRTQSFESVISQPQSTMS